MKKYFTCTMAIVMIISLSACGASEENSETTTKVATENTTSDVATQKSGDVNEKRAKQLEKSVTDLLGKNENAGIKAQSEGTFIYKNIRDATFVYSQERSREYEDKARKTSEEIINVLKQYYGALTFQKENAVNIGRGENGVDSVLYNFYYIGKNGGEIRIQIDSDGVVSYIESGCKFDKGV